MEETTENKNTGYKAAIIILFAVLVISNVTQTVLHNDIENRWSMERRSLICAISDSTPRFELHELNHFTNELDTEYITIWSIKPIGFINYSLGVTGFKTILYDVIFNFVTVDETNGSIEVWKENSTYTGYMTFDVAIANNREPMNTGGIYKIFYVYNAFQFYEFYDIVYYEKIETGRVD